MSRLNFLLALFIMVTAADALAATDAGTGRIIFSGAVMASGCNVEQAQNHVRASCYRSGQDIVTLLSLQVSDTLPSGIARIDVEWLDPQRRQGVLTVNYL